MKIESLFGKEENQHFLKRKNFEKKFQSPRKNLSKKFFQFFLLASDLSEMKKYEAYLFKEF